MNGRCRSRTLDARHVSVFPRSLRTGTMCGDMSEPNCPWARRRLVRTPSVLVVIAVLSAAVSGCSSTEATSAPPPEATRQATAHLGVQHAPRQGSLTAHERWLATTTARRQQRKVIGTFIGATAFATHGTPFDPGSACDLNERLLNVRLVWKADANFVHDPGPNPLPDGPRKSLLIVVDPMNGHVCETAAQYREVGADDDETLLYGDWPDPADG
jgi:hypothetical protein